MTQVGAASTERDFRRLSFWHDTLPNPPTARRAIDGDFRADVAIVGAGYTGLWTAWYLKRFEPSLSIVMLEAETAGFGASGRNGGWCSAYLSGIDHWLNDPARREAAIRLQQTMFRTVSDLGRAVDEAGIDCHYGQAGALEIAVNPGQLRRLEEEFEDLQQWGFTESAFRWLDRDEVQQTLDVQGALAAIHLRHCAAVHPARLARGLAEQLEQRGVTIFENSAATSFGSRCVDTARGRVSADTVILATEGYSGSVEGNERRLIPVHSMMVVTEPLDETVFERLNFTRRYCFGNLDRIVTYGHRTADNRIAFGCRGEYFYGSAIRRHFDPQQREFRHVEETLLRFFPSLRDVRFTHAWGGALGVSRSLRPSVQYDPASGLGRAGGYFGNGVAASHLAGQTLAELVCGQVSERTNTPWVNPPDAQRPWEPEPLRWLGFRAARTLMEIADRAEYRGNKRLPGLIDSVLP